MSQLTLRDIASSEEIIVPPEGFVFGRAGGDADIQLDDNTISRRQARVSSRQGTWLLEVMVVPPGQRIPRPQALQEGQTFFIGQSEFEVVMVEEDEPEPAPPPKASARRAAPAAAPGPGRPAARREAVNKTVPSQPAPRYSTPARAAPAGEDDVEHEASGASTRSGAGGGAGEAIKEVFVGVPKGVAFYLVNVPKLLVNPMGVVRRTIEELPNEPLERTGLIGYALPALMATALLGSIAAGIATLVSGGGFALMAFLPIIPLVAAVIASVILGFVFHPVVGWLVRALKGASDERRRSNYFLQMMTVAVITAVPSALGAILGALPIPFINLLGPLLATLTTLVSLFVVYQWWVHGFRVVGWVRYVILALGVLSVVGTGVGLVTGVIATARGFGSGDARATAQVADAEEAARAAEKARGAALAHVGQGDSHEAEGVQRQAKEALVKAGAAGARDVEKPRADVPTTAEEAMEAPPPPAKELDEESPGADGPSAPLQDTGGEVSDAASGYGAFARRLEAVEKKLEADPTLLRNGELERLYGEFLEASHKVDQRFDKERGRHPERERLYRLQRNDHLYRDTAKLVERLADKLGLR